MLEVEGFWSTRSYNFAAEFPLATNVIEVLNLVLSLHPPSSRLSLFLLIYSLIPIKLFSFFIFI